MMHGISSSPERKSRSRATSWARFESRYAPLIHVISKQPISVFLGVTVCEYQQSNTARQVPDCFGIDTGIARYSALLLGQQHLQ